MEKNFSDFSVSDVQRLAGSDAGQQLLTLLRQDHAQAANAAKKSIAGGDYSGLQAQLADIMDDPRAKALLRQLWEEYHG